MHTQITIKKSTTNFINYHTQNPPSVSLNLMSIINATVSGKFDGNSVACNPLINYLTTKTIKKW